MNRSLRRYVLPLFLFLAWTPAVATDGTQLLQDCQDAEQFDERKPVRNPFGIGRCFGFLEGVSGTMESVNSLLPSSLRTCFPEPRLATIQAVRIVLKFLRENPEQHHEAAAYLIALAYRRAFPCKQ